MALNQPAIRQCQRHLHNTLPIPGRHAKDTMFSSKQSVSGDSRLKLLRNIVSVLAMVIVLLLGAVPVQANHMHDAASPVSDVSLESEHFGLQDAAERHGEAAIHCGAPILGPDPISVPCPMTVATVIYFSGDLPRPLGVAAQELRPPRR